MSLCMRVPTGGRGEEEFIRIHAYFRVTQGARCQTDGASIRPDESEGCLHRLTRAQLEVSAGGAQADCCVWSRGLEQSELGR